MMGTRRTHLLDLISICHPAIKRSERDHDPYTDNHHITPHILYTLRIMSITPSPARHPPARMRYIKELLPISHLFLSGHYILLPSHHQLFLPSTDKRNRIQGRESPSVPHSSPAALDWTSRSNRHPKEIGIDQQTRCLGKPVKRITNRDLDLIKRVCSVSRICFLTRVSWTDDCAQVVSSLSSFFPFLLFPPCRPAQCLPASFPLCHPHHQLPISTTLTRPDSPFYCSEQSCTRCDIPHLPFSPFCQSVNAFSAACLAGVSIICSGVAGPDSPHSADAKFP